MKITDKDYYMDGYLYENLKFMKEAVKKDDDFVLLIDGMERAGKSVLAMQIAYFLDPNFNTDKIVYSVKDWHNKVIGAEKYSCILWDEAFRGMSKRQAISNINKKVVQTLMEIGQNNLFLIIVLPTYFELDKYAALHRCKCLIHVHRNTKYERGYFKFYEYTKMKAMYFEGRFKYDYCRRCDFFGRFTNHYPINKDDYIEKKKEALIQLKKDNEDIISKEKRERNILLKFTNDKFYKNLAQMQRDIKKEYPKFGLSIRTIQNLVKDAVYSEE